MFGLILFSGIGIGIIVGLFYMFDLGADAMEYLGGMIVGGFMGALVGGLVGVMVLINTPHPAEVYVNGKRIAKAYSYDVDDGVLAYEDAHDEETHYIKLKGSDDVTFKKVEEK